MLRSRWLLSNCAKHCNTARSRKSEHHSILLATRMLPRKLALSGFVAMALLVPLSSAYQPSAARPLRTRRVPQRGNLRQKLVAPTRQRPIAPTKQTPIFTEGSQAGILSVSLTDVPQQQQQQQRGNLRKAVSPAIKDRTKIGELNVPHLGIGTISWTAKDDEGRIRIDGIAQRARGESRCFLSVLLTWRCYRQLLTGCGSTRIGSGFFRHR